MRGGRPGGQRAEEFAEEQPGESEDVATNEPAQRPPK